MNVYFSEIAVSDVFVSLLDFRLIVNFVKGRSTADCEYQSPLTFSQYQDAALLVVSIIWTDLSHILSACKGIEKRVGNHFMAILARNSPPLLQTMDGLRDRQKKPCHAALLVLSQYIGE
jgi:hypothetical protein